MKPMQIANKNNTTEILNNKPVLVKESLSKVGAILKEIREKKSLSISDIKDLTHIPVHHIAAIEIGERDKLPEDLFLVGFIRRYAKAVGLNENLIINKYLSSESINEYNEAFNMLFENEKDNVIHLRSDKKHSPIFTESAGFFQVYHFYLIIGIFLFVVACYLLFESSNEEPSRAKHYISHSKNHRKEYKASKSHNREVVRNEGEEIDDLETSFAFEEDKNTLNDTSLQEPVIEEISDNDEDINNVFEPDIKELKREEKPEAKSVVKIVTPKPEVKPQAKLVASKPVVKPEAKPIVKTVIPKMETKSQAKVVASKPVVKPEAKPIAKTITPTTKKPIAASNNKKDVKPVKPVDKVTPPQAASKKEPEVCPIKSRITSTPQIEIAKPAKVEQIPLQNNTENVQIKRVTEIVEPSSNEEVRLRPSIPE